jgi:ABC-type Fe3+/spermidine/putrescine transport system ATPase subunit
MTAIQIDHIDKRYAAQPVLHDVSLQVRAGELLTLLGASGSGKTTLLRILAGLERADAGSVRFGDAVVQGERVFVPPQRRGLGMVFQSYALWPHLDVAGNLALALREQGKGRAEIAQRIDEALQTVGLAGMQRRAIHQLSGGQQQRVALARALVAQPRVLLMDEPLSNLDAGLRDELRDQIRALQQRLGITTVFVTHDQTEALAISDRIALLHQGRLVALGTPEAIYQQPPSAYVAQFLGKANVLRARWDGSALRLGGAVLPALVPASIAAGHDVSVVIRPQNLCWADAAAADAAVFAAQVRQVHLLGALREYHLDVPALGVELTLAELSSQPQRGGAQRVALPRAALRVLPPPQTGSAGG